MRYFLRSFLPRKSSFFSDLPFLFFCKTEVGRKIPRVTRGPQVGRKELKVSTLASPHSTNETNTGTKRTGESETHQLLCSASSWSPNPPNVSSPPSWASVARKLISSYWWLYPVCLVLPTEYTEPTMFGQFRLRRVWWGRYILRNLVWCN